jgi:hypothetical protein
MRPIKGRKPETCVNSPVWSPMEQTGVPDSEKIQNCIQHVLSKRRLWLTGEEFLAQVEARRAGKDLSGQKPIDPTPSEVIEYQLKPSLEFMPKSTVEKIKDGAQ